MSQRWVSLDVGETLVDETRVFDVWATLLDVPRFTLFAAIGATVLGANNHQHAFEMVGRPEWQSFIPEFKRRYGGFQPSDLYPDALSCIQGLTERGYRLAIIANQPRERTNDLRALGVQADVMAMSEELGLSKPDPAFFARSLELMGNPDPREVAYVGDRLDNDVRPAIAAGMRAVWLRRGPWGVIGDAEGPPPETALIVRTLDELLAGADQVWPVAAGATRG